MRIVVAACNRGAESAVAFIKNQVAHHEMRRQESTMNSFTSIRYSAGSVVFAVIAITTLAACAAQAYDTNYRFEVLNRPAPGMATIELVDAHTGQRVSDATLFTVKWAYGGAKNVPPHQQQIELKANGDVTFMVRADTGDTLHLTAHLPGVNDLVRGSVSVPQ
jgi:hypothetical protein